MSSPGQLATRPSRLLRLYFEALFQQFGPQGWWPAKTRLEVILGAILTQNTSWHNAALALKQLRKAGLLNLASLNRIPLPEIESKIRAAGYFRQKARTIRNFLVWLEIECSGSIRKLFDRPSEGLRTELLRIGGLGPETVDAILLYAGRRPYFVSDAYTRRILIRHGHLPQGSGYTRAQEFLHSHLPADAELFNEYHALLVEAGKRHCKSAAPKCQGCPLEKYPHGSQATSWQPRNVMPESQASAMNQPEVLR